MAQATASTRTEVSARLPNSIAPWMPSAGVVVSEPASHCGQVGQPRPEPVTRTTPPVRMIRMLTSSAAVVPHRSARRPSTTRSASHANGRPRPGPHGVALGAHRSSSASTAMPMKTSESDPIEAWKTRIGAARSPDSALA